MIKKILVSLLLIPLLCGCSINITINNDSDSKKTEEPKKTTTKREETEVEIIDQVLGYWFNDENKICIEFYKDNGKNIFIAGWVASEAYAMGEIGNLKKINDDTYTFIVDGKSFELKTNELGDKRILINDISYIFISTDLEKGQEIVLDKYYN